MIHITTIIGARPQIIKAAAISRTIQRFFPGEIRECIVHTGQHYDENMSAIFFDQLNIPKPDLNLQAGSGSHGRQTALMIEGIERLLTENRPDFVLIYGDTNSTLAAAIAASKIHVPIAHVEAGLRSYNKSMPEEVNRIVADHLSTFLFTPTLTGFQNLIREGFHPEPRTRFTADHPGIFHCGDVMYDNMLYFKAQATQQSEILQQLKLKKNQFLLATLHRDHNTDHPERLAAIIRAFISLVNEYSIPLVLPLHPRTLKLLPVNLSPELYQQFTTNPFIRIIPPASFFDMIMLEASCRLVITDSGGVQKEAFFNEKPCVILRPETEWTEIIEHHCGLLADADTPRIINATHHFMHHPVLTFPPLYGDGNAGNFICTTLLESAR